MPNSSGIVVQCLGITDLKLLYSPTLLTAVVCYLKADSRQHFMREDHSVPEMWRLMGMTQRATNHLLHSQTISVEINLK